MQCKFCEKKVTPKKCRGGLEKIYCSNKCARNFAMMKYLKKLYRGDGDGDRQLKH